ncbi:ribosomal protein [Nesidiocoris tenuis]|uniref:Large ribosomal subunit protein eL6 n=1 Tax=Nesidiocoris tenuis TaxID=355587 RepID=A0ABN7B215_9HEMI|nr:ribosomal protein [Nesidiocoris tenuis]
MVATPADKNAVKKTKVAGAGKGKVTKKGRQGNRRNYDLGCGVYRFSRTRMYHKKALWKFMGKKTKKTEKPKKKVTVVKEIKGEKNGGKRTVFLKKRTKLYPTTNKVNRHPSKKCFSDHKRRLRRSLQPGKIVIILAGLHKGKRAVLLKALPSGLLLITGPFTLNGVPLRRIHPNFVISTATSIDVAKVRGLKALNDKYFKRVKAKRVKKDNQDLFAQKKEQYKPSEQRKIDQKNVDKQVLKAISKRKGEAGMLRKYLCTMFGFRSSQYPHRMKF